jgi:hypothetical protein
MVGNELRISAFLAMGGAFLAVLVGLAAFGSPSAAPMSGWAPGLALGLASSASSFAMVLLAFGMRAVRGRTPVIALGMLGGVVGLASGGAQLFGGDADLLVRVSIMCSAGAAAAYGLSYAKPRPELAQYSLIAFVSTIAAILTGSILNQFQVQWAGLATLLAAAGWGALGKFCYSSANSE